MPLLKQLPQGAKRVLRRAGAAVGSVTAVRGDPADIVLTFDDGPDPTGTESVLEALSDRGASATFFVLLTRVRLHPGLLHEVVAAGHEVALHGPDHRPLTAYRYNEACTRTADARAELEDVLGQAVRWFRPPYGRQTPSTWFASTNAGLTPVLWGPTVWDWRHVTQEERVAKSQEGARGGAIVLAHDAFAGPSDGAPAESVPVVDRGDLIERVLDRYEALGLRPCSLGEALTRGKLVRDAVFRK